MSFRLHRLDATYAATFERPLMALVGEAPRAITQAYRTFAERYPSIQPNVFRALNSNVLAEVGIGMVVLNGRLEIGVRVDQIVGQATNLQTPEEVRFAQDCALLAHQVARKLDETIAVGTTTFKISAWLNIEGGKTAVENLLSRVSKPSSGLPPFQRIGAESLRYWPRIELASDAQDWRLTVTAEPSAIANADLFLLRDFAFGQKSNLRSFEHQISFVDLATAAITEWLGIGALEQ